MLQSQARHDGSAQAWGITAFVRRVPHAVVRVRVSGRHLGRASALRRNLFERFDGRPADGGVPRAGTRDSGGTEEAPRQSLRTEHDAEHTVAVPGPPIWTGDSLRNGV